MEQERMPTGRKPSDTYIRYSSFAFQLLGGIGFAGYGGYRLDKYLELKFPVFLLTFVLMAFVGILYRTYRNLNKE